MNPKLAHQNPWWQSAKAIDSDRKLVALRQLSLVWTPPVDEIDFETDGILTLRGPRQVGKSTLLKLLVRHLLKQGRAPQHLLFLDVPRAGVVRQAELAALLDTYLDWVAPTRDGARLTILLDEVTGIPHWATAIRGLADEGRLEGTTILATGSNARDVKEGGDRLPGRRGKRPALDYLLHPLSFRDYLAVTEPELHGRLPHLSAVDATDPKAIHATIHTTAFDDALLTARFSRYLMTGGFLPVINDEALQGTIPESTYQAYRSSVLGELARMRGRESQLRAVVAWLDGRMGEEFDWRDMARESGIANHETVRHFTEKLEDAYLWYVFWRVKEAGTCQPALQSPKKLYPLDPFMWHLLSAWSRGTDGWPQTLETLSDDTRCGHLVESVVADHLRRLRGLFAFYHRTKGGEEIDFITCARGQVDGRIEVKYRTTVGPRDRAPLARHGGGLLLTKEALAWHDEQQVLDIPLAYMLACWPCPSLSVSLAQ